ncbi:GrpB family protein [Bradyrhizobium diazoefficiens]|nr:GrpB family protein [Bradyrhizobium diazoefficiens]MBR0773546.1 GrpB family protein [Bradyrhizobium diazoefficiens]
MSLDEPVSLIPYSAEWPQQFVAERTRLAMRSGLAEADIEHIGSTAVPDLPAKDIIDLMVGLHCWPPDEATTVSILGSGYEAFGEAGVPGRFYLRRRAQPAFNLHVVERSGPHWVRNLALRDYLRANGAARIRYAAIKQQIIESGTTMLLAYSRAKGAHVDQLIIESMEAKLRVS